MSLKKEQYDKIMAEYAAIQDRHRRELEKRRMRAYARIPALQQLEQDTPSKAVGLLRKRLADGAGRTEGMKGASASVSFREEAQRITEKKKALLLENGFPADYLDMTWDCPDCQDTGYTGREKCHCLRRREISVLYDQSHLEALSGEASFALLSEEYYSGEDLQHFRKARRICERFVAEFDEEHRNLYLYGTVGTGKTLLSACAARELIERGRSVLYFSAASLFDRLADCTFGSGGIHRDALHELTADLYGCDLLIIDDLGTEFTNAFVASQLFTCISERGMNLKSTIISTNLSLQELQTRYSDRVLSRIVSSYEICKLTGKDIRLQKRRRGRR